MLRISFGGNVDLDMADSNEMLWSNQPQGLEQVSRAVESPIEIAEGLCINAVLSTEHPLVLLHHVYLNT